MVQIYTFTYGLNFKHKKELEKCFVSSDNYLDGTCTLLLLSVEL